MIRNQGLGLRTLSNDCLPILHKYWNPMITRRPLLVLLLLLSLSACACEKPVGMANPASVYCLEQDGVLEIRKNDDGGEYGVCHMPDGTEIEEWALFRRDHHE